jgi:hypothetical protein
MSYIQVKAKNSSTRSTAIKKGSDFRGLTPLEIRYNVHPQHGDNTSLSHPDASISALLSSRQQRVKRQQM